MTNDQLTAIVQRIREMHVNPQPVVRIGDMFDATSTHGYRLEDGTPLMHARTHPHSQQPELAFSHPDMAWVVENLWHILYTVVALDHDVKRLKAAPRPTLPPEPVGLVSDDGLTVGELETLVARIRSSHREYVPAPTPSPWGKDYCGRCEHPLSEADTCTIRFPHCFGKPPTAAQALEAMTAEYILEEDLAVYAWTLRDEALRLQAEVEAYQAGLHAAKTLEMYRVMQSEEVLRLQAENAALRAERDARVARPTDEYTAWQFMLYQFPEKSRTETPRILTDMTNAFEDFDEGVQHVLREYDLTHVQPRIMDEYYTPQPTQVIFDCVDKDATEDNLYKTLYSPKYYRVIARLITVTRKGVTHDRA